MNFLSCYRQFHYDNVIIIMLYVFSTNSTISYHLKASLYMLYFVSYCTDNIPWEKLRHTQLCPITVSPLKINMYFQSKKFWNVILRQLSSILSHYCLHNLRNHPYATTATQCTRKKIVYRGAHQWVILVVFGKFHPSSYYGLGCGPNTEIEKI